MLLVLVFHSISSKLKFNQKMVQVVTDYRRIICYLRKVTMKEENSDVAYTVFLIETDRMIPF